MGPSLELLIPVAIALYSMQQDDSCTISPAKNPLAENVCQGLRAGLHDGCKRLLSVPLKSGISLVGAYSVTPANFPPLVKQKIGEAYHACDRFWSGETTFPQYKIELADKASVLNELFKATNTIDQAAQMNAALVAAGATADAITDPDSAKDDLRRECDRPQASASPGCLLTPDPERTPRIPTSLPPSAADLTRLADEIGKLATKVTTLSSEVTKLVPQRISPVAAGWTSLIQTRFDTGSHEISRASCDQLLQKIAASGSGTRKVLIHGSADERGDGTTNDILSMRRAAATATCLTTSKAGAALIIQLIGTGAMATPAAGYAQARTATVYISP